MALITTYFTGGVHTGIPVSAYYEKKYKKICLFELKKKVMKNIIFTFTKFCRLKFFIIKEQEHAKSKFIVTVFIKFRYMSHKQ